MAPPARAFLPIQFLLTTHPQAVMIYQLQLFFIFLPLDKQAHKIL